MRVAIAFHEDRWLFLSPPDLNLLTPQLTITPSVTNPCVEFLAVEDTLALEGEEKLVLYLSGPPYVLITNGFLTIYIEDSDGIVWMFSIVG